VAGSDGRRSAFAAAAAANPLEVADLRADPERLRPLLAATGGAARFLGDGATPAIPDIRRVAAGATWPGRAGSGCAATATTP
jgi:hypothetical protein